MRKWIVGRWIPLSAVLLGLVISAVAFARNAIRNEREYLGVVVDRLGERRPPRPPQLPQGDPIETWSTIANDACALDHTPVAPGENRVFGHQFGPTRTSRAMAMIYLAMYEAMNAITPKYHSYVGIEPMPPTPPVDERAAVAQATYDVMKALYPSHEARLTTMLDQYLARIPNLASKARGIQLGEECASAVIALRENDGSDHDDPIVGIDFRLSRKPLNWQPDPVSQSTVALGARWSNVEPFVLTSASQFRAPAPPASRTDDYANAYEEVKQIGGDGIVTPTTRTAEQTQIGIFWAYDGASKIGVAPRLYNQIALTIAKQKGTDGVDLARLLALLNIGMADATITCWESKYFYNLWRPITGIREAQRDANSETSRDVNYTPLGAPASNTQGPNGTPPFPAYPSGHATIGATVFEILRRFYGTDNVRFSFMSDELNGVTLDANGQVRPKVTRTFQTFSQAELENGQSRIYLGVHWAYDATAGNIQGRQVGNLVYSQLMTPLP